MTYRKQTGGLAAFIITGAAILFVPALPAFAEDPVNTGYFGDVAIKGYDPVAYFTENQAVEGSPAYSYRWLGADWHFVNAENRDRFIVRLLVRRTLTQTGGVLGEQVTSIRLAAAY